MTSTTVTVHSARRYTLPVGDPAVALLLTCHTHAITTELHVDLGDPDRPAWFLAPGLPSPCGHLADHADQAAAELTRQRQGLHPRR